MTQARRQLVGSSRRRSRSAFERSGGTRAIDALLGGIDLDSSGFQPSNHVRELSWGAAPGCYGSRRWRLQFQREFDGGNENASGF